MKKTVHKGGLYIVSIALALLGLVGASYTSLAQKLTVLGKSIPVDEDASGINPDTISTMRKIGMALGLGIIQPKHFASQNLKVIWMYGASMWRGFLTLR